MTTANRTAALLALAYHLPERTCGNDELAASFPDLNVERSEAKLGIFRRHIAAENETSADLAIKAAQKLFDCGIVRRGDIDFVILCTQSPDYYLPTTACVIQEKLELSTRVGALDINLGCSGFVYGLGVAKALVETQQAKHLLLLTADTYSKFLHSDDRSSRMIFGDGAAASLIGLASSASPDHVYIDRPLYGTDGHGAKNLIVKRGGLRSRDRGTDMESFLYMNGPEIFHLTLGAVASNIKDCLRLAKLGVSDIDLFVPHQANAFMLESLCAKVGFPRDRMSVRLADTGNTVSASIPIALAKEVEAGRIEPDMKLLLSGFGVGYSWASVLLQWHRDFGIVRIG